MIVLTKELEMKQIIKQKSFAAKYFTALLLILSVFGLLAPNTAMAVLSVTTTPTSGTYSVYPGAAYTLTATPASGTSPYTYKWAKNGTSSYISNATLATYTINQVPVSATGTYYAVVTDDAAATVVSDPIVLNVSTAVTLVPKTLSPDGLNLDGTFMMSGVDYSFTVPNYQSGGRHKSSKVLLFVELAAGFPAKIEFNWNPSVVQKRLKLSPYQLGIVYDYPKLLGPLPLELVDTNGTVTFRRSVDAGNLLAILPVVIP